MKFFAQYDQMDCGPACLCMISSFYKKNYTLKYLRENSFITKEGVSVLGIKKAGEKIGFKVTTLKIDLTSLKKIKNVLPAVLHWEQNHFVVLKKIKRSFFSKRYKYHILDPAHGDVVLEEEDFCKKWTYSLEKKGIIIFFKPTEEFYSQYPQKENNLKLKNLLSYLKPFKKQVIYLFFTLLFGSVISMLFPFLTQYLIDKGINKKDVNFLVIILLAQLTLFVGSITIEIIRNRILLFVGTRVSINIISKFLEKLLNLPIKFFDTKLLGDFRQRIQDNRRIETFLTSDSLRTFFSILTVSVFMVVLLYYDYKILVIYLLFTSISIFWSVFWLKKRKYLDYFLFQENSKNQDSLYEILSGITELKLNEYENYKRKEWENIQNKLFELKIKILKIEQLQLSGFQFFNQLKNTFILFLASYYVILDSLTLGELLSISFILGQMNSPIDQILNFIRNFQDSKLSLERINEIYEHKPEDYNLEIENKITIENSIRLENVSFKYDKININYTLKDINLNIPKGKITAIVGTSGSGKTTLMKLLLKFYEPLEGNIYYDDKNIKDISSLSLRKNTGVVMQDGFIFSDSILKNIITKDENIDYDSLNKVIEITNLKDFIESLPLKLDTKIGSSGNGISGGQKQRILIARAIYKNPEFIFFDEATSFLDSENERLIHGNLLKFFKNKTVLIIAHRLSTVKNADNIIVLEKGKIVEKGSHNILISNKSYYFNLIKNQLEL